MSAICQWLAIRIAPLNRQAAANRTLARSDCGNDLNFCSYVLAEQLDICDSVPSNNRLVPFSRLLAAWRQCLQTPHIARTEMTDCCRLADCRTQCAILRKTSNGRLAAGGGNLRLDGQVSSTLSQLVSGSEIQHEAATSRGPGSHAGGPPRSMDLFLAISCTCPNECFRGETMLPLALLAHNLLHTCQSGYTVMSGECTLYCLVGALCKMVSGVVVRGRAWRVACLLLACPCQVRQFDARALMVPSIPRIEAPLLCRHTSRNLARAHAHIRPLGRKRFLSEYVNGTAAGSYDWGIRGHTFEQRSGACPKTRCSTFKFLCVERVRKQPTYIRLMYSLVSLC
jgi:hypothetical protein